MIESLGTSVVFDADRLVVGSFMVIDSNLMYVSNIDGEKVVLKPVTGWPLFKYRAGKFWKENQFPFIGTIIIAGIIILFGYFHIERYFKF